MNNKPIGIFDSGVGAVAVLRTAQNILPNEKYLLYADFKNAPYGDKTKEEILGLAKNGVSRLIENGAKAVVVACNTATSAAINELRAEYDGMIPIVGMEPAIKPAVNKINSGNVLVLATPATLKFMKFKNLAESLGSKNIIPVECPDLSKLIEDEKPGSKIIKDYLNALLNNYDLNNIDGAVIGCTHFSFIEEDIKNAIGCDCVFDGRYGTVRHLKNILKDNGLFAENNNGIEFIMDKKDNEFYPLIKDFMQRHLSFTE